MRTQYKTSRGQPVFIIRGSNLQIVTFFKTCFSPPARWGLLDFMSDARLLARVLLPRPSSFLLPRHLVLPRPSSSFLLLAGSHLPALDRSGPRRTSSASSWSQWASPDLICQLLIAVGLAGLQPARVWALWASPDFKSERRGPRRTSTGEGRSAVGLAGLPPARFGALCASPDFNRRDLARRGPRRTLTGPQRLETKPYRMPKNIQKRMSEDMPMSEDLPDRMSEDMPDRMSEDMPDRVSEDMPMSEDMPDRMSEGMPDRMSEDLPDRKSEDLPDRMPDRYAR